MLPEPLDADVAVNHVALLPTLHEHSEAVDSVTLPEPPPAGIEIDVALSEYVQPDACETLNASPPIVNVPLRAGPVFAPNE